MQNTDTYLVNLGVGGLVSLDSELKTCGDCDQRSTRHDEAPEHLRSCLIGSHGAEGMSSFRYVPITSGETKRAQPTAFRSAAAALAANAANRRASSSAGSGAKRLPDIPSKSTSVISNGHQKQQDITILSDDEDDEDVIPLGEETEQIGPPPGTLQEWSSSGTLHRDESQNNDDLGMDESDDEEAMRKLEDELQSIDSQLSKLKELRRVIQSDHDALRRKTDASKRITAVSKGDAVQNRQLGREAGVTDYTRSDFEWSKRIRRTAKEVFGIESFRHSQEAVINAGFAGRDIVCIMPTGGGKSLTYQLPAIMASRGTTVVITPLISLMDDQCFNLRELGVNAEMLNASTTSEDQRSIMKRLVGNSQAPTTKKGKAKAEPQETELDEKDLIKLVYVTPERIDKSKTFINALSKMYDAGLIVRFVIDEAHCVSTLGMDYRPSYLALKRLKALFPTTPITATTATAPAHVVADMIKTLTLPSRTSPGDAAQPNTTVKFTSPLFRPNLRFSVVPKPPSAAAQAQAIVDMILTSHSNHIGIVYCLSRNDTENVTKALHELSKGQIRAAIYHAGLDDGEKLRIYDRWRKGKIKIVVATSASFGLGIDNPSVRFVIHHSPPKSMSSLSQEAGRAGRDGNLADCILFWRAADASRLSTLIVDEFRSGGKERLYEMIQYAEDVKTCRKLAFAKSFDGGAQASNKTAARFDEGPDADRPCGNCDNCLRDPSTVESVDVSLEAYRALRIMSAADAASGTLTLTQACDLVRGLGKGAITTTSNDSRGKVNKGKANIDVDSVAGGKVSLNKDQTEQLLVRLMIEGYLSEHFHTTGYTTTSYLRPRPLAMRFTRFKPEQIAQSHGEDLHISIVLQVRKDGKDRASSNKSGKRKQGPSSTAAAKKKLKKSGIEMIELDDDEDDDEGEGEEEAYHDEEDEYSKLEPAADYSQNEPDDDELEAATDADGWEIWSAAS
ncbi:BQ2448_1416 [Microbotryum intermedium]|uniref:ATP-dependent DNA helicase n=1 Tax=Microbotryum intermedium TaxID=269621 RepID=A0A238F827_9BASI|nr:BQ2448_1416 [Microbotryum intermedium]